MWIRSQRKNALVNINFLRVINDGNFCLICGATTDGYGCELGIYSSEEKARRVLDEIQAIIESKQFCVVGRGTFTRPVLHECLQNQCVAYKFGKCLKYDNNTEYSESLDEKKELKGEL